VSEKSIPPLTLYNLYTYGSIATIFGTNVAELVGSENVLYFPPHLTNASARPGGTGNQEIASFHLKAASFFTKKHETQLKRITWSELNHPSLSKWSTQCTR